MEKIYDCDVPEGYAETMQCLNRPASWDVAGIIEDMQEKLRANGDVPNGQILAALDWMTTRLQEVFRFRHFAERLLNPEDLGRAVPGHVRDEVRELLGIPRCEQAR